MNKQKTQKKGLVPRLRFPEFRDAGEWNNDALGNLFVERKETGDEDIPLLSLTEKEGLILQQNSGRKDNSSANKSKYLRVSAGDIAYNTMRMWEGRSALATNEGLVSPAYTVCTPKDQVDSRFFSYYFKTKQLIRQFRRYSQGLVKDTLNLKFEAFSQIHVFFPGLYEQQKIADCLGSLDDLIAAEGRKLAALQDHKKGLMQQLFPREGKTRPRLRFPEFQDRGKWEEHVLHNITTKVGSGITPRGGDKNYKTTGRPFIRSQNVGCGELFLDDLVFIDESTHSSFDATEIHMLDVLLNITGASIGRSAVADDKIAGGNVNQHVCIIRTKIEELNPILLNQFLISERGQRQIDSFQAGGNRQGLNFAQIRSFVIPLPPTNTEQRKIADCLSSLDDQIIAQSKRIDALKDHKKGLMQQLFPVLEEVGLS
ncbi:restriction endonuclease subunit S [Desulfobulbus oligotrophicus]|uniref:Restriction endonuclease subunit S n=1 Tax=Desulfobulbus oligotrophicus TaxID=1909699 RepID=A0A7T5VD21_9BACT|nr:restriction endonuclease subunit S [Desulfobulbus oligotrophicus]QQG65670.1 restriction endonuclease subunit S [Desulfobulbus oligotrophicus]